MDNGDDDLSALPDALAGVDETALADGRQSERALDIQRGTTRFIRDLGWSCLTEFPLPGGRRVDIIALSPDGQFWIVEIKSSLEDFRVDSKWREYLEFCDRYSFAVGPDFPRDVLPLETGLLVADRYGAELLVESEVNKLSGARRKSLTLRYARAAALRLQRLGDPQSFSS